MRIIYQRPVLTEEEHKICARVARDLFMTKRRDQQIIFVVNLLAENARLTKEVNEHREARDIEPLPVYNG